MSIKKKIVWLPYDMDTAIGINNEGLLVFSYNLEDTDQIDGRDVYDGLAQKSVIWNNIRDAFSKELAEMYRTLRSQGKLSYETINKAFQDHQAKWPEALFNEDSQFCYLDPLINDGTNYLEMLQGSKEEQRKWWLYNRFRYMDSKFNAGYALSDFITVRSYAKSDITITPYADIYPTVKFGSYLVQKRGQRNVATVLECPVDALNDTETYIYSASQLASVGDLSGLKVGFADFSMATKLQSLKLGDSSVSYENANLKTLTLGNNVLLQTIDVRNCTALGSGDMKVVDISGCTGIQKAWFDNTKITALTLPIGGVLDTLSLPSTITNLTVRNQPKLISFTLQGDDYSSVSTCRVENTDYFLKDQTWLNKILATQASGGLKDGCRLRLVGLDIDWLADATAISAFYDKLERLRGLDINGETLDHAYVEGVIHIDSITGAEKAELKARYPYVEIDALHIASKLYFYNGATLITSVNVIDGGDGTYTGSTPTKADSSDGHYSYTFAGWSKDTDDGTVDADALKSVTEDRNVYACFTATTKKYTVTYVRASADGGGTLYTLSNVDWGTTITAASSYGGSTPTTTQGSATDYPFEGWTPASATVQGDTTFTAKFGSPVEVAEITDSWDTIIANIDNGTYSTKYKIGNYKPLDLGTEGTINMQIVAMDADELASGGYAPLTFIGMELPITQKKVADNTTDGWGQGVLRSYLQDTILPLVSSTNTNVASRIQRVIKVQSIYENGQVVVNGQTSIDKLWIPSVYEMTGEKTYETSGVTYATFYKDRNSRIKKWVENNSARLYSLRSVTNNTNRAEISANGGIYNRSINIDSAYALGFCLGLEPETIEDSWSTILANTNPSASYAIGDTKMIDLGTEGKHLMEIVAFDEDDKADGSGKAKITWISKDLLKTTHMMNDTQTTEGGWSASGLRTYLQNTIKPLIPSTVRNAIVEVSKISSTYENGAFVANGQTTTDDIWIPSAYEVNGSSNETVGAKYHTKFTADNTSRIKNLDGINSDWYLRSVRMNNLFRCVILTGTIGSSYSQDSKGIVLGFCTD